MLEALIVTLREGIEAALVVALVLAYLERTGQPQLKRSVYIGLAAAVVASVAGAALFQAIGVDLESEIFEGTVLLVAATFVGTMVVWMWRAGRSHARKLQAEIERVVAGSADARRVAWGLGLFTFAMVGREGIETVLFLAGLSASVGGNPLNNVIGGSAGLLLATLIGYLIVRGSVRINYKRFFSMTGVVLLILVAKLIASGIHEFTEVGLLPASRTELKVIGFFTRQTTSVLILVLLIALPALTILWDAWHSKAPAAVAEESPAERRKRLAQNRKGRRWATAIAVVGLLASSGLLVSAASGSGKGYDPMPIMLHLDGGMIHIPVSALADRKLHKYAVEIESTTERFFLLQRADGSVATAFDACAICPPKGYIQRRRQLVCKNCDAPINIESVGEPGGCNPIPMQSTLRDGSVTVTASALATGVSHFKGT